MLRHNSSFRNRGLDTSYDLTASQLAATMQYAAAVRHGPHVSEETMAAVSLLYGCKQDEATQATSPSREINQTGPGLGSQLMRAASNQFKRFAAHGDILSFSKHTVFPRTTHGELYQAGECAGHNIACWFPPPPRSVRDDCSTAPSTENLLRQLSTNSTRWAIFTSLAAQSWLIPARHVVHTAAVLERAALQGGAQVSMAIHVRRGDRLRKERLTLWSQSQVASVVRARHEGPNCPGMKWCGGTTLIASDDLNFARGVKRELEAAGLAVSLLDELRPASMSEIDFLLASFWLIASAPVVMASSGSNIGRFLFWLAGTRHGRVPAVVDMDGIWNSSAMANGFFPCDPKYSTDTVPKDQYRSRSNSPQGICKAAFQSVSPSYT